MSGIGPPGLNPPLFGQASDAVSAGVTGQNDNAQGLQIGSGVLGSSATFGVIGEIPDGLGNETPPAAPAGVLGRGGNNGDGVLGNSINHAGVVGDSINFDGVVGTAHQSGSAGVSGHNPAGGIAVFSDGRLEVKGDVHVTSLLTVDGKINDVDLNDLLNRVQALENSVQVLKDRLSNTQPNGGCSGTFNGRLDLHISRDFSRWSFTGGALRAIHESRS